MRTSLHKSNMGLNGEYAQHVRARTGQKRATSKARRRQGRAEVAEQATGRTRWES